MSQLDDGREIIKKLVQRYAGNQASYTRSSSAYNETQLRTDFLNEFLRALGWDVVNTEYAPHRLREVIVEEAISVEDEESKKKPDYTLRRNGERVFFLEAKKPKVPVATAKDPAFQTRRYGWSAGLAISVLTNFDKLAVYDCSIRPIADDEVNVGRIKIYDYTEYETKFDEIYDRLSRESVLSGRYDEIVGSTSTQAGTEPFDQYFLIQIERWRDRLARSIAADHPTLTPTELNFLIQRFINRIIFLRICEDRDQEKHERLRKIKTYDQLKSLFQEADRRYNSSLFDFIEDKLSLNITVDSALLISLFEELYLPHSSYNFSVVDPGILGQIYEQFIANQIEVAQDRSVTVVPKPEVAQSGGVVRTPQYIVDRIVSDSLLPLLAGKSPKELSQLKIADIACGSGIFLIGAFELLLDHTLDWYQNNNLDTQPEAVYRMPSGDWRLTLAEKHRLLLSCIYGVDIDIQAVEITRFSLLLKVLENEDRAHIDAQLEGSRTKALPNLDNNIQCGNSLVDSAYFQFDKDAMASGTQLVNINPFDWPLAFPRIMDSGGFDAVIGNPPYIRIQNMVRYSPREIAYYQSDYSPYTTAKKNNFDKYTLFIERSIALVKRNGVIGLIVPHKFCTIKSGQALRKLLSEGRYVRGIIHFGVQQIFLPRQTYTCILYLSKRENSTLDVELVLDLAAWKRGNQGITYSLPPEELTESPWIFTAPQLGSLFERIQSRSDVKPLGTKYGVADIFVGLQTSADKVYIVKPIEEINDLVRFTDSKGRLWEVERAVLRACIRDVKFLPFGSPEPNSYMIFPYHIDNGRAVLYTPDAMQTRFPLCWQYLRSFKEELQSRNIQGGTEDTWYRFGRAQSLTYFDGSPKIIWPVLTLEPRYVYDDQNVLFTGGGNGPYYGLRPLPASSLSPFYLMAVLSHPLLEMMVRRSGSPFRGGYISHGKQFVEKLPIRVIDPEDRQGKVLYEEIVQRARQLVGITNQYSAASVPQMRAIFQRQRERLRIEIEEMVSRLYDLTAEDHALLSSISKSEDEQDEF